MKEIFSIAPFFLILVASCLEIEGVKSNHHFSFFLLHSCYLILKIYFSRVLHPVLTEILEPVVMCGGNLDPEQERHPAGDQ